MPLKCNIFLIGNKHKSDARSSDSWSGRFVWNQLLLATICYKTNFLFETRLGVPSIAGRLLKVIETCVYDLSLQTHTPLHYILGLSSQPLTPAKRWQNFEIWSRGTSCSNRCLWSLSNSTRFRKEFVIKSFDVPKIDKIPIVDCRIQHTWQSKMLSKWCKQCTQNLWFFQSKCPTSHCDYFF